MNGLKKKFHKGFSLIEIIIVIALLALVSALVIPRIRRQPVSLSKTVEQQLNNLLQQAKNNALTVQKLHRIMFDLKTNVAQIEVAQEKKDSQGKNVFKKLEIPYTKTSFTLDPEIAVERFVVNGRNLMNKSDDLSYTGMWFFITPDGMVQEVEINMYDQNKKQNFSLKVNPFFAKAELV